jgi:hypothetical protein
MQNHLQYSSQQNVQNDISDMGDMIDQLPSDKSIPSHNEIRIFDQLFHTKKTIFDKILVNTKDILIIGVLFILFSIAPLDSLIKKFIPLSNTSSYILIGAKTVLFMITYFIIKNIYLSRKL